MRALAPLVLLSVLLVAALETSAHSAVSQGAVTWTGTLTTQDGHTGSISIGRLHLISVPYTYYRRGRFRCEGEGCNTGRGRIEFTPTALRDESESTEQVVLEPTSMVFRAGGRVFLYCTFFREPPIALEPGPCRAHAFYWCFERGAPVPQPVVAKGTLELVRVRCGREPCAAGVPCL